MKKKIIGIGLIVLICVGMFAGCVTSNERTKSFGASKTITLPANAKLTDIEWEGENLWYMTRPMRDDEIAETYIYEEDSAYGVMHGKVTIVEVKE